MLRERRLIRQQEVVSVLQAVNFYAKEGIFRDGSPKGGEAVGVALEGEYRF